jgi:hypothetical protein
MAILGKAIARYLSGIRGLYSVELPESLLQEMLELVELANAAESHRALLVTDDPGLSSSAVSTSWRDILRWRTTDDRAFVWTRGLRQPDTSFVSVVRPFISTRFPGADGGECTLELLVRITVAELWQKRNKQPIGDAFEAFHRTALWVANVLRYMFERVGSTPSVHWSDRFLEHWASILKAVDGSLTSYLGEPEPRHAWELVRVSGLPLPSSIVHGNPFLHEPAELPDKEWRALAELWEDIVKSFVLPEGNIAFLLSALDLQVLSATKISPWRGLAWSKVANMPLDVAPPLVGTRIFSDAVSPTMVSASVPAFPIAPIPSWWGVTSSDLDRARQRLRDRTSLSADPNCSGLIRLIPTDPSPFVLNTKVGTVTHSHTKKKWRARILVDDVRILFKEDWQNLYLAETAPANGADGDGWINPELVKVDGRGTKTDSIVTSASPGGQLLITCSLSVEYGSNKDEAGNVSGSWNAERSLSVSIWVHRYSEGEWDGGREVQTDFELIIPSPYSPTLAVIDSKNRVDVAPDTQDEFQANATSPDIWTAEATPTVILKEEGPYGICVYDGTLQPDNPAFAPLSQPSVGSVIMGTAQGSFFPMITCNLDDAVLVTDSAIGRLPDIAVFRVKQRSPNLSSSLLSAVRGLPAGRKPPSTQASQSVLGQYQQKVARALSNRPSALPNSLYQYAISSSEVFASWPEHSGLPEPLIMFETPPGFVLPGIANGPSTTVTGSAEWQDFMRALDEVCTGLGLVPGAENLWLSGVDLSALSPETVKKYVDSHRNLVKLAKQHAATDLFWCSYPLSVVVVEGKHGVNFGQLKAVLLSPLHPARLAWSFAGTFLARNSNSGRALLGLLEGWNIPFTGTAINPAGQFRQLVAVPTDPGPEQDFVAWSALAVLDESGLAELPVFGGGQPLPWGGRTGINGRVVERALIDYLNVHPHVNSVQFDIRSVSPSPRSQEIDDAVLTLLGGLELSEMKHLGGGVTIWDSSERHGPPPTRDKLFSIRGESDSDRSFEWKIYPPDRRPMDSDVALVENASVHLAVSPAEAQGLLGMLPVRRFIPSSLQSPSLDQFFFPREEQDLLHLSALLRELETSGNQALRLRSTPHLQGLGIGESAKWEVLGTFNLDPAQLSAVVDQSTGSRLLWEWRPSWMPFESKESDLGRRPYYVVARVPASLLKALQSRQGFDSSQASELLRVLGARGIGLTSLNAHGGTQESAAAGFFYALQLFLSPSASMTASTGEVLGVMPIDPLQPIIEALAGKKFEKRADLLAISVSVMPVTGVKICFIPVEVKHHGMPGQPEPIPDESDGELKRARLQLVQTAQMITAIQGNMSSSADAAGACLKRVGLATLVDLAMSFSASTPAPVQQSQILASILSGEIHIGIGNPVLMWFAPGSLQSSGAPCVIDRYGPTTIEGKRIRELYIDPSAVPGLWWSQAQMGPNESEVRDQVNEVLLAARSECGAGTTVVPGLIADLSKIFETASVSTDAQAPEINPSSLVSEFKESEPSVETGEMELPPTPLASTTSFEQQTEASTAAIDAESSAAAKIVEMATPHAFIGWSSPTTRWTTLGKIASTNEPVALDLDHPKTIGIFGYMGSGKSYLVGDLIESAVAAIPGINNLPVPLAVVVFNYRRNSSDRFELSSLSLPNQDARDVDMLSREYNTSPSRLPDVHVLCLPGELRSERQREYGDLSAQELFFDPVTIGVEDWELLMGEPGSEAVFARTIRNTLIDLRASGEVTFENLEQQVLARLTGQSRSAARLRFDFVRRYISEDRGAHFEHLLKPGRVLIVDLRQPLFNKDDALRFFLVCANQISRIQGRFNKLVVFDEAHEYMSESFGERMEARIRLMRHEGTSYVFATQDVRSIPVGISRFLSSRFVFDLGTRENTQDLEQVAPEFRGIRLSGIQPGRCYVQASTSIGNIFAKPKEIRVRPRITQHGGRSQIFTIDEE